ncbi:hypothetical protein ACQP3L_30805, partial [Escherichia coli]
GNGRNRLCTQATKASPHRTFFWGCMNQNGEIALITDYEIQICLFLSLSAAATIARVLAH